MAYPAHESLKRDGKTETLDAIDASVWVRRQRNWVCAMHTETLAEKPA